MFNIPFKFIVVVVVVLVLVLVLVLVVVFPCTFACWNSKEVDLNFYLSNKRTVTDVFSNRSASCLLLSRMYIQWLYRCNFTMVKNSQPQWGCPVWNPRMKQPDETQQVEVPSFHRLSAKYKSQLGTDAGWDVKIWPDTSWDPGSCNDPPILGGSNNPTNLW